MLETYSERFQTFKMELFAKIVNYFRKQLHLRRFSRFWVLLWVCSCWLSWLNLPFFMLHEIFSSSLVELQKSFISTAWKVSVFGIILVRIFPHWDWIRRDTEYLSVFSPNTEKHGLKWWCWWKLQSYRILLWC